MSAPTSRFLRVVEAVRGPLDFALRGDGAGAERVRDLAATLAGALDGVESLDVPGDAKRRFGEAAKSLRSADGSGEWADLLRGMKRRIGKLLEPAYPLAVLAHGTDNVPGVGPKIAQALARKEIHTVEDLLFFLPRAYEDRRELVKIEQLQVGHPACFEATVTRAGEIPLRRGRRFFQAVVSDATGSVQLKWFRGIAHFRDRIRPGTRLLVAGDVRRYRYTKELHHPDVDVLDPDAPIDTLPRIIPVYSAVEGVPPRTVRRVVEAAVHYAADLVDPHLPAATARALELPEIGESLRQVHLPSPHLDPAELRERRTPYHRCLVAEELLLLQVGLELRRQSVARRRTEPLAADGEAVRDAIDGLPFRLTGDQRRAWTEIAADLCQPHPMNRLLVGDVGTGKTVLALLGAVAAHASDGLTAVLAPTEILAEQHLRTFEALTRPMGLRTALLTGSTPAPERRSLRRLLALGEVHIIVGTHALLTEGVELPRLKLVVIDEQHRFGVDQRQKLREKGQSPHVLVMSATPIPRTLALTLFGDLDRSELRERPPGRRPVTTRVVPRSAGRQVLAEVRRTLERGEQVYVVYPLVEESEKQDLLDATRGFERLVRALPDSEVALIHGRLDARERLRVMAAFTRGDVRVLVSTTVIEVGVDVPNATLLVVQHADRFGLAQLHQLRGRVGRGANPGRAILIADPTTDDAGRRLAVLEGSASGFDIAEEDLRIRGAGEWLGTRQAGHLPELRLADLVRHRELLDACAEAAAALVRPDPELRRHPRLAQAVERRWGRRLAFGAVA